MSDFLLQNFNIKMLSTSNLIQPGGKIYELTGEQSNKSSTARTRNSGLKQLDMFLQTKKCDYTIWSKKS